MLPPAGIDCHNIAPRNGHHRPRSMSELNMADVLLRPGPDDGMLPAVTPQLPPQPFVFVATNWWFEGGVGLTLNQQQQQQHQQQQQQQQQQDANTPPSDWEPPPSRFSDSSSSGVEPPSPETPSPHGNPVQVTGHSPSDSPTPSPAPSATENDNDEHTSNNNNEVTEQWDEDLTPEERTILLNSAEYARNRRRPGQRRNAVQLEVSPIQRPRIPTPPPLDLSPATPLTPLRDGSESNRRGHNYNNYRPNGNEINDMNSNNRHDDNNNNSNHNNEVHHHQSTSRTPFPSPTTPRARPTCSFPPSERETAGEILAPGLLRRLGRPFSGPWVGSSSGLPPLPLSPSSVGCFSGLKRFCSFRRHRRRR
jgi:hypothetical protein